MPCSRHRTAYRHDDLAGRSASGKFYRRPKKAVEEELAKVAAGEWAKGVKFVTAIRYGAPFVEITKHAKENNVDMIVIGTHGRTGLIHAMMGSVAEKVVRKAGCPVLTVRPQGHQFVVL